MHGETDGLHSARSHFVDQLQAVGADAEAGDFIAASIDGEEEPAVVADGDGPLHGTRGIDGWPRPPVSNDWSYWSLPSRKTKETTLFCALPLLRV